MVASYRGTRLTHRNPFRLGQHVGRAILATFPVFVITLVFQRQITEGITAGAVK